MQNNLVKCGLSVSRQRALSGSEPSFLQCNACSTLLAVAVPGLFLVQLTPATFMRAVPVILVLERLVACVLAMHAGSLGACYGAQHLAALAPVPWAALCGGVHLLFKDRADCPALRTDVAVRNMLNRCGAVLSAA